MFPATHLAAKNPARTKDRTMMATKTEITGVVAEHIAAVNAFDLDAIISTFAQDALVNDARREFWGADAIRRWVSKEMIGDHVTLQVIDVIEHYDTTIVRARYDGDYDKTNLPDELIMTNYITTHNDKIVSLIVIRNQPAGY
jgi:hypothetical protein